ncbi:helix-turn-helix domain-containing protein [Lacihabitans soyangensis]|uniref:XRE family transcriptional regulator n=1 Tax=Lacihabitans soyangensis TaxID=869394 RepID=A0AAE3KSD2_9BACT|nr:helix-turn-helix transcriptional regulator [Lacihabitans soyangensis]MCP9762983.1 XRE family transcriptional regulator [Lacihabitans soyangensis]
MNNSRNTDLLKKFGANLKRLRESKGLSQEELCFKSGLSKNQIGNIERGEVNTTISTLAAIGLALELPASDLLKFDI